MLALAVCSIAGYGFEVYHSRGKDIVMAILLLAMMIPFAATMIPLFQLFARVGMVNSLWAVVIPMISTPFLILLFRQASRSFPHDIIEAARIDGLREFSIFARIYVPTMRSTFAAAARDHVHDGVEQLPLAQGDPRQQRASRRCRCSPRTSAPGTSPTTAC